MSKKILVLESSVTIQKLFTTTLDSDEYTVQFIGDGKAVVYQLFESLPDLLLLNAEAENPRSFEIVRIVRSIPCFKSLTIGMYATSPFPFDEEMAENCGADSFVHIDQKTMALNVDELAQLSAQKLDRLAVSQAKKETDDGRLFLNAMQLLRRDSVHALALSRIMSMLNSLESMEDIVTVYLSLIAEFCEVPAVGLYLVEHDGPHGYYVGAGEMSERDVADFLNVCAADFEKIQPDYNAAKVQPRRLSASADLNRFFTKNVQLSSYENAVLSTSDGAKFGSVHIVSEGNISTEKQDFFSFCARNSGVLFEKALIVKQKIFFERHIRRAFSRFVPEQIIDDLVVADNNTEEKVAVGEKRAVAILFSDIRSFTSISELNKPEVIVAFLNRYFTTMVNAIKKHGGTIDKFIGDAIMAEFGCPVSYEDNARRAVAAAYEMREALPTVPLDDLVLPEGMKFNIGIGIHYGDVTVGSIGSSDKTDYTVIGDSVNLASRLEGLTKTYGTMIIVSESVKQDVPAGDFVFRYLDDVKVKGKKLPVPIYALDKTELDFPAEYRDAYSKGLGLYRQGVFNLAKEYFDKALAAMPEDKAAGLMQERCVEFIANPPENWDGAITFHTK